MLQKNQSGVALITAMVITTIAVSLAATVMYRQQIQIRLSSNISHLEQSYLYANGMEDWAGTILEKSFKDHPEYDSLQDDWYSDQALILPITGGIMQGRLYDLQARINLNSLNRPKPVVKEGQENPDENINDDEENKDGEGKDEDETDQANNQNPYVAQITRQRLIKLLDLVADTQQDMGAPENFADIAKDWIDNDKTNGNQEPNGDSSGSGAESPYYQSLEPAYYSANTELVSITEVRLFKDMKEEIYSKLRDMVTTLPIKDVKNEPVETPINVNTASEDIFKAIGFDPGAIENIIEVRKDEPFKTMEDFKKLSVVASIVDEQREDISLENLDVKSSFFLLQGSVEINNARLFINSILERKNGRVSVIMRDFSNPDTIKTKDKN